MTTRILVAGPIVAPGLSPRVAAMRRAASGPRVAAARASRWSVRRARAPPHGARAGSECVPQRRHHLLYGGGIRCDSSPRIAAGTSPKLETFDCRMARAMRRENGLDSAQIRAARQRGRWETRGYLRLQRLERRSGGGARMVRCASRDLGRVGSQRRYPSHSCDTACPRTTVSRRNGRVRAVSPAPACSWLTSDPAHVSCSDAAID